MEILKPVSCIAKTNHIDAISETKALSVFDGGSILKVGAGNLWFDLTYTYSNTPYIKNMSVGYLWGFPNPVSWLLSAAQGSRCMIGCEDNDGNRSQLYDTGILISNVFGIQTKEFSFEVNKYVKNINVYISCSAIAPEITLYGLATLGVFDSGIRFRKGNTTYSLARTQNLQQGGLRFIDSSRSERSLSLISSTNPNASPIRITPSIAIEKL